MTDWEKSLRLRKGEFSVLGAEPSAAAPQQQQQQPGQGIFADSPAWVFDSAAPLVQGERRCARARPGGPEGCLPGFLGCRS